MARVPAVEVAPGVVRIPTVGAANTNSFALVDDDGSVTLVDCGLTRAPAKIVQGLRDLGKQPGDVQRIILTHAHVDHAGGVADVAVRTGAEVEVHEADAGYVRAGVSAPPDTSLTMGRLMARGPDQRFAPVSVGRELRDGDVVDVAGGVRVVHTPGHTPGHVSLLHESDEVLVTGDSLFNIRGIRWPFAAACTDAAQACETARRLVDLPYSLVAFTHGKEIRAGGRDAIAAFLAGR
jgi:glyoxylase-like metal-dependent hydrolase (beta-lactamase superfamily II)